MKTRVVEIGACINCPYYNDKLGLCEITNNKVIYMFSLDTGCPLLTIDEYIEKYKDKYSD